jgi:hypothetical protein
MSYSFMLGLPPIIKVQSITTGYMAWFASGTTGIQQGEGSYGKTKQEAIQNLYNT